MLYTKCSCIKICVRFYTMSVTSCLDILRVVLARGSCIAFYHFGDK